MRSGPGVLASGRLQRPPGRALVRATLVQDLDWGRPGLAVPPSSPLGRGGRGALFGRRADRGPRALDCVRRPWGRRQPPAEACGPRRRPGQRDRELRVGGSEPDRSGLACRAGCPWPDMARDAAGRTSVRCLRLTGPRVTKCRSQQDGPPPSARLRHRGLPHRGLPHWGRAQAATSAATATGGRASGGRYSASAPSMAVLRRGFVR